MLACRCACTAFPFKNNVTDKPRRIPSSERTHKAKERMKHLKYLAICICLFGGAIAQTSCDIIDDDLSDCGKDYRLVYRTRLITNMDDELNTVLADDSIMRVTLRQQLQSVFSDQGRNLDLSFYRTIVADSARQLHAPEPMNGPVSDAFTFYLPAEQYHNLAIANLREEPVVSLLQDSLCHTSRLLQQTADTINSHVNGLFTGRKLVDVPQRDTTVYVDMYMANCAAALVIDTVNIATRAIRVFVTDMASEFHVADSAYIFGRSYATRATELRHSQSRSRAYPAVTFPSANRPAVSRATVTERGDTGEGSIWRILALVDMPDGTTTYNVIYVRQPLRAANLKVIRVTLQGDGSLWPVDVAIGVGVQLDWHPGIEWEV